jgi:hypothetical protein
MSASSHVTAQGTIATFGSTTLTRVTNNALTDGAVALDDTDLSHNRENNQTGIATVSGSIDCLGYTPQLTVGQDGNFVLSGAVSKDYGLCRIMDIGIGTPVKGQATIKYTIASTAETAAT